MKYSNMNFHSINFTETQLRVIEGNEYLIYLKAGAGTGKTETLIQKIIYILESYPEITLNNIGVISFTNKATSEMKNRLEQSLYHKSLEFKQSGNAVLADKFKEQAYLVNISNISTIHSFCERILRRYSLEMNCSPNYVVSSYSSKARDIVRSTIKLIFENKEITEISEDVIENLILELYRDNLNKGIYKIDNCYENVFTPLGILRKRFISAYNQAVSKIEENKLEDNVITLNDSIEKVNLLLRIERVRSSISEKFKYIFIDEYQDTNFSQFKITKSFIDMGIKVFLVGDDKQAIYRFRGADINNSVTMSKYIKKFNNTKLELSENFRSDPKIIKTINSIFSSPFTYNSEPVTFFNTPLKASKINTKSEEMPAMLHDDSNIVDIVQNLISNRTIKGKPVGYGDIAILCRKNYMVDNISELFKNVGIPVEVIGGHGFYRAKEITDIYKYLNYIVYRKEEYKKELKFSDIYKSLLNYKYDNFDKFLENLCDIAQGNSVGAVFDFLIETSNIYQYYADAGLYQSIANIEKLKSSAYSEVDSDYMSIIKFLEFISNKITMGAEEDEAEVSDINREKGVVSIYTVHKAKGLSFPIVIISNMDENLINYKKLPSVIMKIKNDKVGLGFSEKVINKDDVQYKKLIEQHITELLEEELRVFYVACTRAKHMLVFSCNKNLSYTLKSKNATWAKWLLESNVLKNGDVYMNKDYVSNIKNRFLKTSSNGLVNEEILALILSYVDPYRDTNQISKALLKRFGSIKGLLDADAEDIAIVENVGLNSAILIKTYTEFMRAYLKESKNTKNISLTDKDIKSLVNTNLLGRSKEHMFLILMNAKSELIHSEILREGNINSVDVYTDEIVRLCIKYKAVYVVIAHNHPSGNTLPSSNDVETTEKLHSALKLINVKLMDHIIFAENKCVSLQRAFGDDLFN